MSWGAETSGEVKIVCALNHCSTAVKTHQANFPGAKHINSRIELVQPSECKRIRFLLAGPSCTFHSNARGGLPTSDQERADPWHILPWIEHHRPSFVVIENVPEFRKWGPIGEDGFPLKKFRGRYFETWIKAIESSGYKVDFRVLVAADFGAVTSRKRLFVIARKGNRAPRWPEPSHTRNVGNALPGMHLPGWRSAYEIVDWSIPCPSIFRRKRNLEDKTLLRLEAGVRRFVGAFIAKFLGNESAESLMAPVSTITAGGGHHGLCIPFGVDVSHGLDGHRHGRTYRLGDPVRTITTSNGMGLALPFLSRQYGTKGGKFNPNRGIDEPLSTVTTVDHHGLAVPFQFQLIGKGAGRSRDIVNPVPTIVASRENHGVAIPWLSHYYGTCNHSPLTDPLDTVTTKDRHALALGVCSGPDDWPAPHSEAMGMLQSTMREFYVSDLLFRMLSNRELALATGFPPEYVFHGTSKEITKQIGNSVPPAFAHHICRSIAG